jgi:uncharacterized membrane protein/protein-disulfide isomerase
MSNSQSHATGSGSLVTSQSDVLSFRATIAAGRLRLLRGLCLAALLISGYLAWSAIQLRPVIGCGGSDLIDCDHVLNSHWSKIFGLPVSIPAVGLYATLLGLLAFAGSPVPAAFRRLLLTALSCGFLVAGWAALWFIGLQLVVLKHLCPWCLAAHLCGLALSVWALTVGAPQSRLRITATGLMLASGLAVTQVLTPATAAYEVVVPDYAKAAQSNAAEQVAAPTEEFAAPAEDFAAPADPAPAVPATAAPPPPPAAAPEQAPAAETFEPPVAVVPGNSRPARMAGPLLAMSLKSLILLPAGQPDENGQPAQTEATGQAVASPRTTRKVTILGTEKPITLDPAGWPLLGTADARFIFVEMFDYTCPHCRETHQSIRGAFERFGQDLAVIALPVPLESECNRAASGGGHAGSCELSRLAVAVWRCDRGKFREFHDWLFDRSRTPAAARRQAERLVGRDPLRAELDSGTPGKFVDRHVDLYIKLGAGTVPKLLFSDRSVIGSVQKAPLCSMISEHMERAPAE